MSEYCIMKLFKSVNGGTYFLLFIFFFLFSCNKDNPVSKEEEKKLTVEIIPSAEVSIPWDSLTFQHKTIYSDYDTTFADSVSQMLKESPLPVKEMWAPKNFLTPCDFPMRSGSEIILQLSKPDNRVYDYGFQKGEGFAVGCFNYWRHYVYSVNQ